MHTPADAWGTAVAAEGGGLMNGSGGDGDVVMEEDGDTPELYSPDEEDEDEDEDEFQYEDDDEIEEDDDEEEEEGVEVHVSGTQACLPLPSQRHSSPSCCGQFCIVWAVGQHNICWSSSCDATMCVFMDTH